jgi:chlorite dismutase
MILIPADMLMSNNFYLLSKQVRVDTIHTHISVGKIYTCYITIII